MRYADPDNSAFPLEPPARASVAHDAIHRLYNDSRYGRSTAAHVAPMGGAAAGYDGAKFAQVHAEAVRAMLDAGYDHRLRCDGTLDHSLPQDLFDRSKPPAGAVIDAQALMAHFSAQGELASDSPVEVEIPADVLARIKKVDPEPFIVSGMISKAGTILRVPGRDPGEVHEVELTREFLAEVAAQIPVVQHPEHFDRQRGVHARRSNASYMLAAALTPVGDELWGKAWIPASQADLLNEVKAGFAVGLPPAWSTECFSAQDRDGDRFRFRFRPRPGTIKLLSIDWAETGRPGVPGAGPSKVISAQNTQPSKEDPMTEQERAAFLASLTPDELKTGRPDLVDQLVSAQTADADATAEITRLTEANAGLQKQVDEFEKTRLTAQLKLKRDELLTAIEDDAIRDVADGLLSGQTAEELDANWPGVQARVAKLTKPMPVIDGGDTKPGEKKPDQLRY